jgi:hypothetical protein
MDLIYTLSLVVRNHMSDFSRTYTRSKKKTRVDESEGDRDPIEQSGASSGPILRPRMTRASQPIVDKIVEERNEASSNDDEESDDDYMMQFRHGKGLLLMMMVMN